MTSLQGASLALTTSVTMATLSPNQLSIKEGVPHTPTTFQDLFSNASTEDVPLSSNQVTRTDFTATVVFGIVTMVIINLLALFGNLCVFVVIVKTPHLRCQLTYFFVLNLCFVDLLNSLIVLPFATASFALDNWILGSAFCNVHGILTSTFMFVSILSLSVISMERYYSIRMPMHYAANMTLTRTLAIIAYVWVQSATVAFLPLFGWNTYEYRAGKGHCSYSWQVDGYHKLYVVFATVICFVLPGTVMVIAYSAIFQVAKKAANQVHPSHTSRNSTPHVPELCTQMSHRADAPGTSRIQDDSGCDVSSDLNGGIRYDVQENPRDGISTISKTLPVPSDEFRRQSRCRNFLSKSYMINLNFLTGSIDGNRTPTESHVSTVGSSVGSSRKPGGHWKAVKTLLLIMTIFMVLWAPFFIISLHGVFHGHIPHGNTMEIVVTWLGFSSYSINPFIYGWLNRSVREALSGLLDQIKMSLFANPDSEPDWNTSEDFFQFLERTSTTRTLSVPHSKSNPGGRTPPIVEEFESATIHAG